jgi:glutathione-independent formaldehyde dehydrogenase
VNSWRQSWANRLSTASSMRLGSKRRVMTVRNRLRSYSIRRMEVTRAAGSIGIPGLYVTEDPGSHDKQAAKGALSLRFGLGWSKSHSFHTGQTPTLRYNRQLMQAIWHDRLPIADIVNAQVISLEEAPKGYADFDKGAAVKFVLDPHGMVSKAA